MKKRNSENDPHSSLERRRGDVAADERAGENADFPELYGEEEDYSKLDERFGNTPKNEYYAKVASGYRSAKLILVVILVAVILFALVLGSEDITYANLRYLLRNFGEATNNDTELAEIIEFHGDQNAVCDIFGDKLAVASGEGISLYRLSGKRILSDTEEKGGTQLVCGSKYFLTWSSGGKTLYIYNSVSLVGKSEFDYPIYGVSADGNGGFAVLSRDRLHTSSVYVYDSDLQRTASKNIANDYAVAIALSKDGALLSTASFTTEDGEYLSKLDITDIKSGETLHTYTYKGEFPLETGCFAGGGYYILTDLAAYIYGQDGELIVREQYNGKIALTAADDRHLCVVSSSTGAVSANHIEVISETGRIAARFSSDSVVSDVCLTDDNVFLLASSVICVSLEDSGKTALDRAQNAKALITDGSNVYCVYTGRAELIYSDGAPVVKNDNNVNN